MNDATVAVLRSRALVLALAVCGFGGSLPTELCAQARGGGAAQEWEVGLEGGLDFRSGYEDDGETVGSVPASGTEQSTPAPSAAVAFHLRIPNLRAYYGLRLEGHLADTEGPLGDGATYTAAALLDYKAFLFDMEGDCDCPRWDKTNFLKKAFFVEFGLGYARQSFSRDGAGEQSRGGVAYLARLGLSLRLRKQLDVFLAGGAHGLIGEEWATGRHDVGVRPALGLTWRPRYHRF